MGLGLFLKQVCNRSELPSDYDQPSDDDKVNSFGVEEFNDNHLVFGLKANGRKVCVDASSSPEQAQSILKKYRQAYGFVVAL